MGMAASQARYLELTARKTNVEYEGQQINQQRTNLANQSAGMFTQLMSLQVPTPPSTSDYTTLQYTFNDGQNSNTIANIQNVTGDPNYNANVSYYYTQSVYTGVAQIRTDLGARYVGTAPNGTYWLTDGVAGGNNKTQLTQCSLTDQNYATDKKAIEQIIANTGASTNIAQDYARAGTIANIYKYTTTNGVTNYYSVTDLAAMPAQGAKASLTAYYASNLDTKQNVTGLAYITKDDSGRYSTMKLASMPGTTININATSTTDENAYNNAMNEYTYQQQLYQQQVTAINAKTEVIQNEDRTLELQLRQLDTEQQALSTEMEAVKKVVDKNIESTFKTFAS